MKNKVLIVDDNQRNLAILEKILKKEYELARAETGEEAIETALKFRPDVVLLDIMMPGIDGYETCRRLRKEETLGYTKVIMVSARAMVSERLEGYNAGADDYITKPFEPDELLAKVRVFAKLKSVEEIDTLRNGLLSLLAHETLTPITCLTAAAEMLSDPESVATAEERKELISILQHGSDRLKDLVTNVMKLNQARSRNLSMTPESICLSQPLGRAIEHVGPMAESRKVRIQETLSGPGAEAFLDSQEMTSALTTILEKAILSAPEEGTLEVSLIPDSVEARIVIHNPGFETNAADLEHTFDAFLTNKPNSYRGDSGLELAIAREIIEIHNATIETKSEPGRGTDYILRVPVTTRATSKANAE